MGKIIIETLGQIFRSVANFASFVMVCLGIIVVLLLVLMFRVICGC